MFASPSLIVGASNATLLTLDGDLQTISLDDAKKLVIKGSVLICYKPFILDRFKIKSLPKVLDILELFAFTRPAQLCVPSPLGLADALALDTPCDTSDQAICLLNSAKVLLEELTNQAQDPLPIVRAMGKNWPWGAHIFDAFGKGADFDIAPSIDAMNVWQNLPQWEDDEDGGLIDDPPSHHGLDEGRAVLALKSALGSDAEDRKTQCDYAAAISGIFKPPLEDRTPHMVVAQGGTGTGKTLAYLAPSKEWAAQNKASVWVSTYTKALQRQIDSAMDSVYQNENERKNLTAIRKGRENILCLLNLDELTKSPRHKVAAGIMARWAGATPDGDLSGINFPGWLPRLLGWAPTLGLSDKHGECTYAACPHYKKCFVERCIRKSKGAQIVVANHALIMSKAAMAAPDDDMPTHYIFDEGHHLFDAADSAFATTLSAREMSDLRRWVLGVEEGARKTRMRGLARRVQGLIEGDETAEKALRKTLRYARELPDSNWDVKLFDEDCGGGAGQGFLGRIYAQVNSRIKKESKFSTQCEIFPLVDGAGQSAQDLKKALSSIKKSMGELASALRKFLGSEQGAQCDKDTRGRMDSLASGLEWRVNRIIAPWIDMLDAICGGECNDADFVYWFEISRNAKGRLYDVGMMRHWIDPMKPFAGSISCHAHGIGVTSATLKDGAGDGAWNVARLKSGSNWIAKDHVMEHDFKSPFDYRKSSRVFVVQDVNRDDPAQVAAAFSAIMDASGGGALGIFTAISRLKTTYQKIAKDLQAKGIPLYAQHVDAMDVGTLLDLFKMQEDSCLLGTDAVRDGVDVPGRALRTIVMDRVPWPRPSILHKARRAAFGGRKWDDAITRFRLTQAFGRLIRKKDDRGVFVLLDDRLPKRLEDAFPSGMQVTRLGISDTCDELKGFFEDL